MHNYYFHLPVVCVCVYMSMLAVNLWRPEVSPVRTVSSYLCVITTAHLEVGGPAGIGSLCPLWVLGMELRSSGTVVHTFNPGAQEAEAGRSLCV